MTINIREYDFKKSLKEEIPSVDYLTHSIHSYTAKLIPHIPHYVIKRYTKLGDMVLDPFCGSGTTLLEAIINGRNAVGIDIHPVANLISEVKTSPVDINKLALVIKDVKKRLDKLSNYPTIQFPNIDYWFCKDARHELEKIKFTVEELDGNIDKNAIKFLQLCFSSIIRKSSYADPRIAKTYKSKRIIDKIATGWIPKPIQYFEEALDRNFHRVKDLSQLLDSNGSRSLVFQGDAKNLSSLLQRNNMKEINFILTSPPYINAQDYFRSYKLELYWLGTTTLQEVKSLKKQTIGAENLYGDNLDYSLLNSIGLLNEVHMKLMRSNKAKAIIVHKYFENMRSVFQECIKVLEKNGRFCLVAGNNKICGVHIPTNKILSNIAQDIGFTIIETGRDKIRDRSLPPHRNHNEGIIEEELITIFQK